MAQKFKLNIPERSGFSPLQVADFPRLLRKQDRPQYMMTGVRVQPEKNQYFADFSADQLSAPANVAFWETNDQTRASKYPRGSRYGDWTFSMPVRHAGMNSWAASLEANNTDDDFWTKNVSSDVTSQYGLELPYDVLASHMVTSKHGDPKDVVVLSGGPLVSDHLSLSQHRFSRWRYDIDPLTNKLGRGAGEHTNTRVRWWEVCGQRGGMAVSLVGHGVQGPGGGLHVTFGNEDALASYMFSGPLVPSSNKHLLANGLDGPIKAMAIHTDAYYRMIDVLSPQGPVTGPKEPDRVGTLDFKRDPYPAVLRGPVPYEVDLLFDPEEQHPFYCGPRKGKWKWVAWLPIAETPPCEDTKIPALQKVDGDGDRITSVSRFPRITARRDYQTNGIFFQGRPMLLLGGII